MATFVLIHGASHGGWCWHKLIPLLEDAGHQVIAPDMPGHGADRSPTSAATLTAYTDRTCEVLDSLSAPAVLVGHSMGGLILSQAAERRPDKLASLIYLCAFLLPNGTSLLDAVPPGTEHPPFVPNPDDPQGQSLVGHPQHWRDIFYGQCSKADQALARACLVPQNLAAFVEPLQISEPNYGRVPRDYIVCEQDQAIPAGAQRAMCEQMPCRQQLSLDSDHSPMLSHPEQLARHLIQLV